MHELVSDLGAIDAREINSLEIGDGIVLRVGRYGPYLERDGQRASVPEELAPDELTVERAEELLAQPCGDRSSAPIPRPACRSSRVPAATARTSRRSCPMARRRSPAPRRCSSRCRRTRSALDDALRLLQIPRVVGVGEDGEEVVARNGRYGPYVQQGKESRSLESEEQLFTITLRRGARPPCAAPAAARPRGPRRSRCRELGADPVGGSEIVLKEGRFGPYVTDGETNASLRKGDDPETVTLDRAVELLAERRAKGPAKKGGRRRKAS